MLFPASLVGPILIPIMIYYPMQLVVCAWLAKRCAKVAQVSEGREIEPTALSLSIDVILPEQVR